jgi:hypothetical protein
MGGEVRLSKPGQHGGVSEPVTIRERERETPRLKTGSERPKRKLIGPERAARGEIRQRQAKAQRRPTAGVKAR